MQQVIALAIAALVWGVVCFFCGFIVAMLRRLSDENTMLRSTVSALSNPQSPHTKDAAQNIEPTVVVAEKHDDAPLRKSVVASTLSRVERQPSVARKVYRFADAHAEPVTELTPYQLLPMRSSPSAWPGQEHAPRGRAYTTSTDLLPHRPPHSRERWRRRRY